MVKIGERIGAIDYTDKDAVYFFGYGIYLGDEIPPNGFAGMFKRPNPKLQLDDGTIVWGQECWWGSEEKIKEFIGDRKVITAPYLSVSQNPQAEF
jgi:hypothetical protein